MTLRQDPRPHPDVPCVGADEVGYEAETTRAVLPSSVMLAVLLVAFWLLHELVLGVDLGAFQETVLTGALLVSVAIGVLARRRRIPVRGGHPAMAALAAGALVVAAVHLEASGQRSESVPFLFLLVSVGVTMLRRAWFVVSTATVWAVWLACVHEFGGTWEAWAHWDFSMATATGLAVTLLLVRRHGVEASQAALQRAVAAATHDLATGLANRRGLALLADALLARARREGEAVHCAFFDVDGLKAINDAHGHDAGDRAILAVAAALRAACRADDVVARWGGDEFVVLATGGCESAERVARAVQEQLSENLDGDDVLRGVRISTGCAELDASDIAGVDVLLWRADHEMYLRRAVRRGREGSVALEVTAHTA